MAIQDDRQTHGILGRLGHISQVVDAALPAGGNPLQVCMESLRGPTRAVINGAETILLGTNNYLGLNHDPDCVEAAIEGIRTHGTGSTASRVASGTFTPHVELEAAVARLYGWRHAAVFSTAFMANLGIIAGLMKPDDLILIDAHCHASIFDGCALSGASVQTFRHNDPDDLDRRLSETSTPGSRTLIIVEALYSVFGDEAPLEAIVEVKDRHGALLLVDEAHSLGLYGERGSGLVEERGLLDRVEFISGTFSKSAGQIGGYCVSNLPEFKHFYLVARPYLFTASLPPAIVEAAIVALGKMGDGMPHRKRVWENARYLHEALGAMGFSPVSAAAPIIGLPMNGLRQTYFLWRALLDRGVYVNCLVPPATPNGNGVLRCSVSAAHSREELDRAIEAFELAGRETGVLPVKTRVPGE